MRVPQMTFYWVYVLMYMSRSQFGRVYKREVIFKKLGIGSLMLALKPDTGFETVSMHVTRVDIVHHQQHTTSLQTPG